MILTKIATLEFSVLTSVEVSPKIEFNIGINRSRKISGSEADGNFANLGEQVQRSEPVNCCYTRRGTKCRECNAPSERRERSVWVWA